MDDLIDRFSDDENIGLPKDKQESDIVPPVVDPPKSPDDKIDAKDLTVLKYVLATNFRINGKLKVEGTSLTEDDLIAIGEKDFARLLSIGSIKER